MKMPQLWSLDPAPLSISASIGCSGPERSTWSSLAEHRGSTRGDGVPTTNGWWRFVANDALSESHAACNAGFCVREMLCAPRGVHGLGPRRAGRHADSVVVSNGHHKHEQLCVGRSTS